MLTLYAATTNPAKLAEFRAAAAAVSLRLEPLPGLASLPACPEDGTTFEQNARKKAAHYSGHSEALVLAEDSGLEVTALGGAPGVFSARYAGPHATAAQNNEKLLRALGQIAAPERRARFVCVMALARQGRVLHTFEGRVEGLVAPAPSGAGGFGYDPIFLLPELGRTFGELSPEDKLRYSHRGRAFRALLAWLADQKIAPPVL